MANWTIRVLKRDELGKKFKELADESTVELIHMLHDYGNKVSDAQRDLLGRLMDIYAGSAQGVLTARIATPLPTGFGKTTSITALLVTAYKKQMLGEQFTVAVAASQVNQLEDIFEALLRAGIPRSLISLIHHKQDALHPATTGPNGEFIIDRPILLLTHSKVMGRKLNEYLAERTFIRRKSES